MSEHVETTEDPSTYFHGYAGSECAEHRTVGVHRAWCYDCAEWCYPEAPCPGCGLASGRLDEIRGRLDEARDFRTERFYGHAIEDVAYLDALLTQAVYLLTHAQPSVAQAGRMTFAAQIQDWLSLLGEPG